MALVAYSDCSDISDEENEHQLQCPTSENKIKIIEEKNSFDDGLDSIVDEDDDCKTVNINTPTITPSNFTTWSGSSEKQTNLKNGRKVDVTEDIDIVDDVPTVKTWTVTKSLKTEQIKSQPYAIKEKVKKKSRIKFILPALSEFESDEDEDEVDIPKKKIAPSSKGTGLFSVLPEPRGVKSLVPHSVSRRINPVKPKVIKHNSKAAVKPLVEVPKPKFNDTNISNNSDDEDLSLNLDFFSLSKDDSAKVDETPFKIPVFEAMDSNSTICPSISSKSPQSQSLSKTVSYPKPYDGIVEVALRHDEDLSPNPLTCATMPPNVRKNLTNDDALLRLTGKRNKGEIINLIEVNADDNLLTKEEWQTRALTEEKPSQSYSRKKGGLPSGQQKRKHQITFLAHQAKERELELKNNWAQNKMTKMQTQSKYGF